MAVLTNHCPIWYKNMEIHPPKRISRTALFPLRHIDERTSAEQTPIIEREAYKARQLVWRTMAIRTKVAGRRRVVFIIRFTPFIRVTTAMRVKGVIGFF